MAPTQQRNPIFTVPALLGALLVGGLLLAPSAAFAGEVKIGAKALETDDSGKLTAAGSKAAVSELKSEPGEETWNAFVWAKIDKGGPGPLYVEFFGKLPSGKPYLTFRHEHAGYQGEQFVSFEVELSGNLGFNKGKTYNVKVTQVSAKGKDLLLASSKLTLVYTEPPAEEDEEGEEGGASEDDTSAQDEFDTLSGSDPVDGDSADRDSAGPPAVAPKKKGCTVDSAASGFSGIAVLLLVGLGAGRRRRRY